jgi:hypothetical protein
MLSPTFSNNNNTNIPTQAEVHILFRNYRRMTGPFSSWAKTIMHHIPYIIYAYEENEADLDYHGWFEPYIYNYTLHVFYQTSDYVIHHKMFQFANNTRMGDRLNTWNLYKETPVENFDYDTIRLFKTPSVVFPPSRI